MIHRLERNPRDFGLFPESGQFLNGLVSFLFASRFIPTEDPRDKVKAALIEITVEYDRQSVYE
jgi:hypothetical protein